MELHTSNTRCGWVHFGFWSTSDRAGCLPRSRRSRISSSLSASMDPTWDTTVAPELKISRLMTAEGRNNDSVFRLIVALCHFEWTSKKTILRNLGLFCFFVKKLPHFSSNKAKKIICSQSTLDEYKYSGTMFRSKK